MKLSLAAACTVVLVAWFLIGFHVLSADPRIAFLGDSITQSWQYPRANYGIRGNTTAQMLARFGQAISGKGYREVVILGGTNDVLLGIDPNVTIRNLETMAEESVALNAEPVLCKIPPIFHSYRRGDSKDYMPSVIQLDQQITELAQAHHWKLIDYYTPLAGHPRYSADGVHMKRSGYLLMEAALLRGLAMS